VACDALPVVAAAGAGRMGQGIAIVFALAGHRVNLLDLKQRSQDESQRYRRDVFEQLRSTLNMLAAIGVTDGQSIDAQLQRIEFLPHTDIAAAMSEAEFVFECVPETLQAKAQAFAAIGPHLRGDAILSSTTSTILSTELSDLVMQPENFLNAHWLNPAFLVPLVELSPTGHTSDETTARLVALLERTGKVPVVCSASPGYIVPRIQALAMNEAARLVEEGVASAEDIDKATRYGFGFRFAILGLLEFIDWGGGDILYYASQYLTSATGESRFAAPESVRENMQQGRIGLSTGQGFMDYQGLDIDQYRQQRLQQFAALLQHLNIAPVVRQ